MANARSGSVVRVDTSAQFNDVRDIKGVKYVGASSGTASIKADSSSGMVMWEEAGENNVFNEVCMQNQGGVYVTVTNSAVVYIYLK